MYDYLVVGCGLYGVTFGQIAARHGKSVLVIDRRPHIGGNVYTERIDNIDVHMYGAHIFHTNSKEVWKFLCRFTEFNEYRHHPKATYNGKIYSIPFNMNTYNQLWGCITPQEAKEKIESQKIIVDRPRNLEEWALSQVGPDIYETLIYGYTKKQWQREPKDLPSSIIRRLPFRFTYDDCYFNDRYQGIPINGYSHMVENMLNGLTVWLEKDLKDLGDWRKLAKKLVYSGPIDELFDYKFGTLEYRSLRFENKVVEGDFQGTGQMNYTDASVPWTRIIEHKHFMCRPDLSKSVITYEYPEEWNGSNARYYPINDDRNNAIYDKYRQEAKEHTDILIGGRLGKYKYYDMHQVVAAAMHDAYTETHSRKS